MYAPFFDGGWWSAQMVFEGDGPFGASSVTSSLYAANQINGEVGFSGSSTVLGLDGRSWNRTV